MEISGEAIECARLESLENSINQGERYLRGQYVQALVNQSTAPLREEIERLKENRQNLIDGLNRYEPQVENLEKQVLKLRDGLQKTLDYQRRFQHEMRQQNIIFTDGRELINQLKDLLLANPDDLSARYTKREVLEKCVEELRKQIKHLHSSSAYYQSGQSVLTLANEELKKGQRE